MLQMEIMLQEIQSLRNKVSPLHHIVYSASYKSVRMSQDFGLEKQNIKLTLLNGFVCLCEGRSPQKCQQVSPR